MGLFDFLKKKKSPLDETIEKMTKSMFPKGKKDIEAGTRELLYIFDNKVDEGTAQSIFMKSVSKSRISKKFDKEWLKAHLSGYCLQHFTENQIDKFHDYLVALSFAMMINGKTPSDVRREGDAYLW
jgi:hypothetical protein